MTKICEICYCENVKNIIKLPCCIEKYICSVCVLSLQKNECPYCRSGIQIIKKLRLDLYWFYIGYNIVFIISQTIGLSIPIIKLIDRKS